MLDAHVTSDLDALICLKTVLFSKSARNRKLCETHYVLFTSVEQSHDHCRSAYTREKSNSLRVLIRTKIQRTDIPRLGDTPCVW